MRLSIYRTALVCGCHNYIVETSQLDPYTNSDASDISQKMRKELLKFSKYLELLMEMIVRQKQVFEWYRRFREGRENVEDDGRSGRPIKAVTEENVEKVRDFVKISKKS